MLTRLTLSTRVRTIPDQTRSKETVMRRTPRVGRLALGIAALVLVTPLVTAAASSSPSPRGPAAATPNAAPTVNWALASAASATATTTESGYPASNAIDGDAGTDWCTSGWTGTLTVDLGQVRTLSDLGITLDSASPSASASIELAATAGRLAAAARAARPRPGPRQPDVRPAAERHQRPLRRAHRLQRHRRRRLRGRIPRATGPTRPRPAWTWGPTCPSPRRNSPRARRSPTRAARAPR